MKKFFQLAGIAFLAFGCSSDDDSTVFIDPIQVSNTVTSGTWRITSFIEDGNDETNHFTGYDFTFNLNGELTATNGTDTHAGSWDLTTENSNDDSPSGSDIDFEIMFAAPPEFTDLNEDWDILQRTDTRLTLRHTSGGDGSIDHLVFDKN
ncbi:MAG: hypothetical protein ITG00_08875 [Flavobacterium sp.]|nr:hypothetical protein [Flavobacterium sp.]